VTLENSDYRIAGSEFTAYDDVNDAGVNSTCKIATLSRVYSRFTADRHAAFSLFRTAAPFSMNRNRRPTVVRAEAPRRRQVNAALNIRGAECPCTSCCSGMRGSGREKWERGKEGKSIITSAAIAYRQVFASRGARATVIFN